MRLLKNKRAMDYSAFMVIVVFIVLGFLFYQLYVKLGVFEMRVGEQELALMDSYAMGDVLLLYVDQSARYSVYHASEDLAENGGASPGKLPVFSLNDVSFWYKDGKKLYRDIDFYEGFEYFLGRKINDYFAKAPFYVPYDNYEFLIVPDKVIGIALRPVFMHVFPGVEKKEPYAGAMAKMGSDIGIVPFGLGVYSVRPSFSVNVAVHLDDYSVLFQKVDVLLDCIKSEVLSACVDSVRSDDFAWAFVEIPNTNIVIFTVSFNNVKNPYSESRAVVRFALEL